MHQFTARNDYFTIWHGKMTSHQNKGGGAIIDHSGGFGAAEDGEIALHISGATSALAAGEIKFEVAVVG